ncbi:RNA-binding protein [Methanococcus maripaludis]|uniref:RNA-binding protein n=1 Tax=Methanococcus maripaludis TaxID=39152 RepID=A0A7J9S6N5_METMI|nr:Gar1/Naf1 family protein [Methanococcus maripaludis]MBA2840440.1 RNA-binding protein [Methanococcus maripaludis]MBA2853443.1 RNA-binding protein [Methanococcus maripaludis]MBA2860140.1 RNA-binding protein [Methanococcus maripaludis]MBA2869397.1 RNA-binding protein [Methanococcus maripaludis]MBB6402089.1 RNA-binding protein [Methanococcus maripaludis]
MEKIKILHRTPKGKIIGRVKKQPRFNSPVGIKLKDRIKKIGKIYDVFGPVEEPYVKIIPYSEDDAEKTLESDYVFVMNEQPKKQSKPRKKGRR